MAHDNLRRPVFAGVTDQLGGNIAMQGDNRYPKAIRKGKVVPKRFLFFLIRWAGLDIDNHDVRFEPLSALIADNKGMADLEFIITNAQHYLTQQGWLVVEHGYDQGGAVRDLFTANNFDEINTFRDFGRNERVTIGQRVLS